MPSFFVTHYLVSYSTKNNKQNFLLKQILRKYLFQQQRALFEGELTPRQFEQMQKEIKKTIDRKKDVVIIYPLAKQNIFGKIVLGKLRYEISRIY